jgi:Na+/H+-translocating membrane pyrophosphatase
LLDPRHPRQLRRRLVRHPHQHRRQLAHRLLAPCKGNSLATLLIPLRSGMSVGLVLVSIELFFMICILAFLPSSLAGACFVGFAIGESLGASALRICGGIFTKIADIGADLMKIVFQLPEDDPRNPGVIADCTGDNAGDSVGPTADGFETYGVTGVALIAFLALALGRRPRPVRHAHRLALRHAHPDDPHLARLLPAQRRHEPDALRPGTTTSISRRR